MQNWKTTLMGVCAILGALVAVGNGIANGTPVDYTAAFSAVVAGIGLIFAKDASTGVPKV